MFAASNGDEEVTDVLLAAWANVNVKDFEGHTLLDYATNFGQTGLANKLREAAARNIIIATFLSKSEIAGEQGMYELKFSLMGGDEIIVQAEADASLEALASLIKDNLSFDYNINVHIMGCGEGEGDIASAK